MENIRIFFTRVGRSMQMNDLKEVFHTLGV